MKKANAPPTIKEKARLAFIREKASQMKEKSRHKYSVPGPFTAIDSARVIERNDPEPEENSCAADSVEHKTISKLSRAEMVVRYARHQQKRNASHRETHFEPEPETAPEAETAAKPASSQDLMREKTVRDYKTKQRQKEYAASTPEAEILHSPEKADRPYRKTRETAQARCFSRQQLSERSQPTHKQTLTPKVLTYRDQGRRLAQGTAIKETVQKQSRRDMRLRKLKAAVERAARASAQSALTAGGGLLLLVLPLLLLFGAVGALFGGSGDLEKAPVSDEVKAYAGLIQLYAAEHGIPEYTELIMAVMMQESGGQGNDPMQASECAFNTKYPNTPGSISDPEYSIAVGIQNLAACLSQAGAGGPEDIDRVSLALQGYNFGSGYISWALANYGCYSELNALEFSSMMAQRLGWSSYGDPYYVQHVMRYYNITESESE